MHVHASFLSAIATFLQVIIIGFVWRTIALRWHETSAGKAMAFLY